MVSYNFPSKVWGKRGSPEYSTFVSESRSDAGVEVSHDTIFGIPAFRRGVDIISNALARMDCYVYQYGDGNDRNRNENHPAHWLLSVKASEAQSYYSFRQTLIANAVWAGNGYAYIERENGVAIGLHNLDPESVCPYWDVNQFGKVVYLSYDLTTRHGLTSIAPDDIIHIRSVSTKDGVMGLSLIDTLKTNLGMQIASQKYGAAYFKNGGNVNRVIEVPGRLSPEQQAAMRDELRQNYSGPNAANKFFIAYNQMKLSALPGISNEEAQWLQSREFSLIEVADLLGLPATMLNSPSSHSYGALTQDAINLLNYTLDGWATNAEAEFSIKLCTPRQQIRSWIEFDRSSIFTSDPEFRKQTIEEYQLGAISWQEMRARLNLSTVRKGDFIDDKEPEPIPEPEKQPEQPQDEPEQPQDEQPEDEQADNQPIARSLALAALERFKERIIKATKNNPDLEQHYEILEENLRGLDCSPIIAELQGLQAELKACLAEQRAGILAQWDVEAAADKVIHQGK